MQTRRIEMRRYAAAVLVLITVVLGVAILTIWKSAAAQNSGAVSSSAQKLPGLEKPVTVLRDTWGIPHIYAQNQHDMFFAQGYATAQDRLFQMELWKRAGQGA